MNVVAPPTRQRISGGTACQPTVTGHLHAPDDWARQHVEHGASREPHLVPATQALLQAIGLRQGDRVLDVACGAGDTAAAATAAGADATGIDTSRAMVRIAARRFPGTSFKEGDMRAPPAGPWDAIVCRLGAHHADVAWLSAAHGVLKPGGVLAIAERDAVDDGSRANGMKSLGEWMVHFEQAGLVDIRATPSGAQLDGWIYIVSGRRECS